MRLTRGEFCQFNHKTRFKLLQEFGRNVLEKQVRTRLVSIYHISDFYVEVLENYLQSTNGESRSANPLFAGEPNYDTNDIMISMLADRQETAIW